MVVGSSPRPRGSGAQPRRPSRDARAEALRRTARLHRAGRPSGSRSAARRRRDGRRGGPRARVVRGGAARAARAARRDDPAEAHHRFKRLPASEIAAALDQVLSLHVALEQAGWVAGDLYDGCLMYDFGAGRIVVMDFESYREAPTSTTRAGSRDRRGSWPPRSSVLGATIDARTTVFNLGRMVEIFLLARARPAGRRLGGRPGDRTSARRRGRARCATSMLPGALRGSSSARRRPATSRSWPGSRSRPAGSS